MLNIAQFQPSCPKRPLAEWLVSPGHVTSDDMDDDWMVQWPMVVSPGHVTSFKGRALGYP
jgi:hypothetical protein